VNLDDDNFLQTIHQLITINDANGDINCFLSIDKNDCGDHNWFFALTAVILMNSYFIFVLFYPLSPLHPTPHMIHSLCSSRFSKYFSYDQSSHRLSNIYFYFEEIPMFWASGGWFWIFLNKCSKDKYALYLILYKRHKHKTANLLDVNIMK
jgi:hypothetical protein